MGPLGKIWHVLKQASTYWLEDLLKLVQQTVLLVGHSDVTLSCHRRLNALDDTKAISKKAKFMLKMKSDLQKDNKDLFGKNFREQISETIKSHKQGFGKHWFQGSAWHNSTLCRGSSQNESKLRGENILAYKRKFQWSFNNSDCDKWNCWHRGKYKCNSSDLFLGDSIADFKERITVLSCTDHKIIFHKSTFNCTNGRKT